MCTDDAEPNLGAHTGTGLHHHAGRLATVGTVGGGYSVLVGRAAGG